MSDHQQTNSLIEPVRARWQELAAGGRGCMLLHETGPPADVIRFSIPTIAR
jgi:hypothetical protein